MSFGDRMRPWEPGGEVLEVLFGYGGVSVGGLRLGASVSLCLGELDEPQELVDAVADLALRALADGEAEADVVPHRHVLEGRVVLEHKAHAPPACR